MSAAGLASDEVRAALGSPSALSPSLPKPLRADARQLPERSPRFPGRAATMPLLPGLPTVPLPSLPTVPLPPALSPQPRDNTTLDGNGAIPLVPTGELGLQLQKSVTTLKRGRNALHEDT